MLHVGNTTCAKPRVPLSLAASFVSPVTCLIKNRAMVTGTSEDMNLKGGSFMENVMQYVQPVLDFFAAGFNQVNAVQGIIIGVLAAFVLRQYSRILVIGFVATLIHLIVDTALPVIRGAELKLPPLADVEWWKYVLLLYVGYLVVITVFYILKRILIRG